MILPQPSARRRLARAARWLTAITIAGAVIATAGAAQAQTAALATTATRAAPGTALNPQPITLAPGWSGNARFHSRPPSWYIDDSGVVRLEGAVTWAGTGPPGATIGTVPPVATPPANTAVFTIAHTFLGSYTDLQVDNFDGELAIIDAAPPAVSDYHFLSLEGISYRVSGTTQPIQVNSPAWSGNAGAGGRAPAWYRDRSGIVHLQGAFTQTNPNGPNPNVLGWLPLSAAPTIATVYTIAITAPGTYADIAIQPTGEIDVIDPRVPAVKLYAFLSLESITYRQANTGATPIPPASGWSAGAGFNSRGLAWYKDSSGLVHLEGAVGQPNTTGPTLIGTLPAAAAPTSDVYTIVHTLAGTYADLDIKRSGQILLINPSPSLVTDERFVSLESIVYRR
jgi:hypothetical protein